VSERFHRRTSPRRESCPNRVEADLAGLRVPLIGFDEVLAHKRAAGRRRTRETSTRWSGRRSARAARSRHHESHPPILGRSPLTPARYLRGAVTYLLDAHDVR
jgi:hypothetical protein